MLGIGLKQHGFAVWAAANANEAIDLYHSHQQLVDLVLLDVRMPGQDGPTTLSALQQRNHHIRACFMTGDAESIRSATCATGALSRSFKSPSTRTNSRNNSRK
jgi:two-component system, cell cycle sensor histidine kinase and response regulator CckA